MIDGTKMTARLPTMKMVTANFLRPPSIFSSFRKGVCIAMAITAAHNTTEITA